MKALNRLFRDGGMITQVEIDIPDLVIQIVWSDSAKHLLEGICGGCLAVSHGSGLNVLEERDPFCFMP